MYRNFKNQRFRTKLFKELRQGVVDASQGELFQTILLRFLNKLAPTKQKIVRHNQSSFVTKDVRKAIMTRLMLRNKFRKTKSREFKQA